MRGLKENIIGKLIPAGTGMERYRNVEIERGEPYGQGKTRSSTLPPDAQINLPVYDAQRNSSGLMMHNDFDDDNLMDIEFDDTYDDGDDGDVSYDDDVSDFD